MQIIERTGSGTFRSPTYSQPTRSPGANNRKPFSRPQPKPHQEEPKPPSPVREPKGPRNRPGPRGSSRPGSGKLTPLNQGFTSPSGKLTRVGEKAGKKAVQQGGRQIGRQIGQRILGSINTLGKIQNAWDLGTGIGGLGRGLLGLDDTNPYGDIIGFGSAESAWELGNAINNLINPNNQNLDVITVGETSTVDNIETRILNNPFDINDDTWGDIGSDSAGGFIIEAEKVYPNVIPGTREFIETVSQSKAESFSGSSSLVHLRPQYSFLDKDSSSSGNNQDDSTRYNNSSVRYRITNFQGIVVNIVGRGWSTSGSSSYRYGYTTGVGFSYYVWISYSLLGTKIQYYNEETKEWVKLQKPGETILYRSPWFMNSGSSKSSVMVQELDKPWAFIYKSSGQNAKIVTGKHSIKLVDDDKPLNFLPNTNNYYKEFKPMTCKAMDAMKAMEERLKALEGRLNQKLGEEAIDKVEITKTTIDDEGNATQTKEEIELDGISGTVVKILQNQYQDKNDFELINQKLGEKKITKITITKEDGTKEDISVDGIGGGIEYLIPKVEQVEQINEKMGLQIKDDTQLGWGETLAVAGLGGLGGGLGALALFNNKKLGPQITKLPTFNNAGTPTNIIPNITEADTGGIGGGIDKINKEIQEEKHDKAKKHKLELRANLIALLDLALSIHNAFALSSSLIETIVSFMNNVFQMFGFKDENDQPIDVKEVAGESFEKVLEILLGAETAEDVIKFFAKTNRIIQSASNVLFDLQGLTDSVRSISQQTGEYVAKIGNALRRNRIVPDDKEDSYDWMDERMSPTSAFQKRIESISEELSNVTDFMGSLESVTGEVISAQEQFSSLKNNATEFKNLVTASETEKGEKETVDTTNSQSPEIKL